MKYFTKEWCFGGLPDKIVQLNKKKYREYIDSIYMLLPFSLKILAKNINLHDGFLWNIYFAEKTNTLQLNGIFGDLQVGYFYLEIRYLGVNNLTHDRLVTHFNNQKPEILRNELEILPNDLFVHRIIFSSKDEVEIIFQDLEIKIQNTSEDHYEKKVCGLHFL